MTISAMGKFNGNLIEHKENFLFTYRNQGDISLALLEK
jgi:hypothetical protein